MVRKKQTKKFNLGDEYKLCFDYLKKSSAFLIFSTFCFFAFAIIGFFAFYLIPSELLLPLLENIQEWIRELLEKTEGLGFGGMWWFIFNNNIRVAFISIFAGFFFGILPAFLLLVNALFIGFVSAFVFSYQGPITFVQLLPHGIFEIPAILISFALGIKFGTFIFQDIRKSRKEVFLDYLINSARVFLLIILPLLILASFIEAGLIVFMR